VSPPFELFMLIVTMVGLGLWVGIHLRVLHRLDRIERLQGIHERMLEELQARQR